MAAFTSADRDKQDVFPSPKCGWEVVCVIATAFYPGALVNHLAVEPDLYLLITAKEHVCILFSR